FHDPSLAEFCPRPLHDALPSLVGDKLSAFVSGEYERNRFAGIRRRFEEVVSLSFALLNGGRTELALEIGAAFNQQRDLEGVDNSDRKSTRLNSSHVKISYAVFC